jgi:hypothetical protein
MPGNSDLDALVFLAADARKEDAWLEFSRFCERRGQGVRAVAMEHLNNFLLAAASWSLDKRLAFSKWVMWRSRKFDDDRVVLPDPLRKKLLIPTLRSWAEISPNDAEVHLWLGLLRCDDPSGHLDQALKLDPSCELARRTLTNWIIGDVEYNQHELPSFYINDPVEDLNELERASKLASDSTEEPRVRIWQQEIAELRTRAEGWVAAKGRSHGVVPFPGRTTRIFPSGE